MAQPERASAITPFLASGVGTELASNSPFDNRSMALVMQDKLQSLGFVGGLSEMQFQWLGSLGHTAGSLDDRWKLLLDSEAIPDGGMSERQKQHYETQSGVSGLGLNESKRAFWLTL